MTGSENWLFGCARIINRTLLLSTDGADGLYEITNSTVFFLSPGNENLILTKIGALNFVLFVTVLKGTVNRLGGYHVALFRPVGTRHCRSLSSARVTSSVLLNQLRVCHFQSLVSAWRNRVSCFSFSHRSLKMYFFQLKVIHDRKAWFEASAAV